MKKLILFIAFLFITNFTFSQTYLLGPQEFNTDILVHGASAPVTSWFAPNSNPQIDFIATGGCTNSWVGYSGSWNSYWGNFLRMPQVNCTGNDTILMTFDVSHSYFATQPNDWCRFYMWADAGYKNNVISVKIDGVDVTYDSGVNGKGFKLDQLRTCAQVQILFNISAIADKSNILFYIEPSCGYNNSNVFSFKFDNVSIIGGTSIPLPAPTVQASVVTFSNVGLNQLEANWTRGNGSNCAVFIKQTNSGNASPVDNTTYIPNTAFGSGTQIASTGWYCIYSGTGTTATITNLLQATNYRVMVCEFNGNPLGEKYNVLVSTQNPNDTITGNNVGINEFNEENLAISTFENGILFSSSKIIKSMKLYSITGNLVFSNENINVNSFTFSTNSMTSGIYLANIEVNGKFIFKKIHILK
ncbi:MAG: T9SS type A sorting domain-containing protein [Bacteroidetes bacterium]|nr:T9SS type A sorting domain-containing protein [Bacteroidota bacterium]